VNARQGGQNGVRSQASHNEDDRQGELLSARCYGNAEGVNFAIYSKNATEVFLLLFDKADGEPTDIIQLQIAIDSSGMC
jgi:hypothetical protein